MYRPITISLLLCALSAFANDPNANLEKELKKFNCAMQSLSPVGDPEAAGCPGSGPKSKFQRPTEALPVGQQFFIKLYKSLRYEIFGPTVNRMSYQAPTGGTPQGTTKDECAGIIATPLDFAVEKPTLNKCIVAMFHDLKHHSKEYYPMTAIHQCSSFLCEANTIKGIKEHMSENDHKIDTSIEQFLRCENATYDI